jgi:tRNA (guanosine-2'-O-)-methyltransferase
VRESLLPKGPDDRLLRRAMRRNSPGLLDTDALLPLRVRLAEARAPEAVIATLEPFVLERRRDKILRTLGDRLNAVTVVFDDPYDPHNGAAVMRSAEAFGCQTVHIVEREKPFLAATSVTRGAEKWIDVARHKGAESCVSTLQAENFAVVGTHPEGELLPNDLARFEKVALVLGNERDGIRPDLTAACTHFVRVPMRGFVESLNVSVTAAILLAATTAGRKGDLSPAQTRRMYARGLWFSVPNAEQILEATFGPVSVEGMPTT